MGSLVLIVHVSSMDPQARLHIPFSQALLRGLFGGLRHNIRQTSLPGGSDLGDSHKDSRSPRKDSQKSQSGIVGHLNADFRRIFVQALAVQYDVVDECKLFVCKHNCKRTPTK
jgi:hypothetical protein